VKDLIERPANDVAGDAAGDAAFEERSRELLREQTEGLDAHTRSRLNRARQAALAAASGESRSGSRWLLPVGSAAALALVAVSSVQVMRSHREAQVVPNVAMTTTNTADDVEILASNEELDMLQNVEFYAWLDTQSDSMNASSAVSEAG